MILISGKRKHGLWRQFGRSHDYRLVLVLGEKKFYTWAVKSI